MEKSNVSKSKTAKIVLAVILATALLLAIALPIALAEEKIVQAEPEITTTPEAEAETSTPVDTFVEVKEVIPDPAPFVEISDESDEPEPEESNEEAVDAFVPETIIRYGGETFDSADLFKVVMFGTDLENVMSVTAQGGYFIYKECPAVVEMLNPDTQVRIINTDAYFSIENVGYELGDRVTLYILLG